MLNSSKYNISSIYFVGFNSKAIYYVTGLLVLYFIRGDFRIQSRVKCGKSSQPLQTNPLPLARFRIYQKVGKFSEGPWDGFPHFTRY